MDTNRALAAFLLAAQDVANLHTRTGALESKLLAAAIDPLLINCDLFAGQRLMREHEEATRMVIRRLPAAKLKTLSKKWNPYRAPAASEAFSNDLIRELTGLAQGSTKPAPKPPVVTEFSLADGRRWTREHRELMLALIGGLSLAKMKALSKKWNPFRVPAAAQAGGIELSGELKALALGRMTPVAEPPPTPSGRARDGTGRRARAAAAGAPRRRRSARIAAE